MKASFHECDPFKENYSPSRLRSSQNVALLQYKIPQAGEGFVFTVSMEPNRDRKFLSILVTRVSHPAGGGLFRLPRKSKSHFFLGQQPKDYVAESKDQDGLVRQAQ